MMNQTTVYTVTVRKQFPSWDEVDGLVYVVRERSKTEAIKAVRKQARYDGHVGSGEGRYTVTAEEAPEGTMTTEEERAMDAEADRKAMLA